MSKVEEYVVILHYNTGEVFWREINDEDNYLLEYYDAEAFLKKYHLNMDECSFMFTSTKPNFTYLEKD